MKIDWDKLFDVMVSKLHIALGAICQGTVFLFHYKTGRDLGAGVQNTVYAYYAFLLGHAGANLKWGGSDSSADGKSDA